MNHDAYSFSITDKNPLPGIMTGQVLDSPVASLVLPVLMRPILSNLERQDMAASQTLRAALSKVKSQYSLLKISH